MNDSSAYKGGRKSVNIAIDANAIAQGFSDLNVLPLCQGYTFVQNQNILDEYIKIYPNPFSSWIKIIVPENETLIKVQLLSYNGSVIYELLPNSLTHQVSLSQEIPTGNYLLRIITDKRVSTKKVIHE